MRGQYYTCPFCSANLDFGEKCDCQNEKKKQKDFFVQAITVDSNTGQMTFQWDSMQGGDDLCKIK